MHLRLIRIFVGGVHMVPQRFPVVRVWPQEGSTGIWVPGDPLGRVANLMLSYDALELPHRLVGRFVAWQTRFDQDYVPEDDCVSDPARQFWHELRREQAELARLLHHQIGGSVQWDDGQRIWTVGKTKPDTDFARLWCGLLAAA